jgi:hypothetical protein
MAVAIEVTHKACNQAYVILIVGRLHCDARNFSEQAKPGAAAAHRVPMIRFAATDAQWTHEARA